MATNTKFGEKIKNPPVPVSIKVPLDLFTKMVEEIEKQDCTMTAFILSVLEDFFTKKPIK